MKLCKLPTSTDGRGVAVIVVEPLLKQQNIVNWKIIMKKQTNYMEKLVLNCWSSANCFTVFTPWKYNSTTIIMAIFKWT